jgi:hypothetical protein
LFQCFIRPFPTSFDLHVLFSQLDGRIRYRIIGSREYIFTKNLGTIARAHAYQEWSFGTLVLRTYSDLGIRLHYGHPDVFHGIV